MNRNTILIAIASAVGIFAFLWVAYILTNKPQQTSFPQVSTITKTDHVRWSPAKKNILVEYADLQCPACRSFYLFFKQWEATNPKQFKEVEKNITFVYRHFPLPVHAHSVEAAYAAEAAGRQGKFFEYADALFSNQDAWSKSNDVQKLFLDYADKLKLDLEKFKVDMSSSAVKDKVTQDMDQGNSVGVASTPTFFLNGELQDIVSFEDFQQKLSAGK